MKTCPTWSPLLDHRFDPSLAEPEGWDEAIGHLDGCPRCRREAEAIDPTLMFRHLPVPVLGDQDIADMKRAVQVLRTSSAVQHPDTGERLRTGLRRAAAAIDPRHATAAWRVAAAAVLAIGLTAGVAPPPGADFEPPTAGAQAHTAMTVGEIPGWTYGGVEEASFSTGPDAPVVEGIVSPEARVYSFPASPDEQVAVVMVIDPTLDV